MLGIKRLANIKANELSFKRIIEAFRVRIIFPFQFLIYYLPWGFNKLNRERLSSLNDIHKDKKRCFIIASGPSLKDINFELLKGEVTFAMNRGYMLKEQIGFSPTYLVSIDKYIQLLQFKSEFDDFDEIPTFYNWDVRNLFTKKQNRYFIKTQFSPKFLTKLPGMFGNGRSVTYSCIQLAFVMGFQEVYIVGKDHNYNTQEKKVGKPILSSGNDGNHFLNGYFNKGNVYAAPDYRAEEFAYQIGRQAFEMAGRTIKDATINGNLKVFEKVDFFSLF
jgi:hypothetical protein